ncbi:hypothetical protein MCEMRE203_00780 [Candidatus Nanopelagicaceae bacterium]
MTTAPDGPIGESHDEEELIRAEFESMVAGLSLDESAPTTFLDELDAIDTSEQFKEPRIPKRGLRNQINDAINGFKRWRDNPHGRSTDDGSAL